MFEEDPTAAICHYRKAIALSAGDYLQDAPYEDWASEERERLLALYLRTADRLARALAERGEWEETIRVCRAILSRDDCWEQAYRLMMVSYDEMGNRAQMLRTYQRCVERLRGELGVEPSTATVGLCRSILGFTPSIPAPD